MSHLFRIGSRYSLNAPLVRSGVLTLTLLALVTVFAGRASALTCPQGCKKAQAACQTTAKQYAKGCQHICQAVFEASAMDAAAHDAFVACRDACKAGLRSDKDACKATLVTCADACNANPTCAPTCGNALGNCGMIVSGATKACGNACGSDGACREACADPGSVALHRGEAALDNCYNNPNNGFAVCMSGGCTAVCGNNVLEPGEACDDNNTDAGDGCSPTCILEDLDGDGILDDGNGSTVAGDSRCTGGNIANCDDNCQHHPNPAQEDSDGDGVGDVCDYNCTGATGAVIEGGVYVNSLAFPVANALITACSTSCCSWTTSDSAGAYQFLNLQPGDYRVTAQPSGDALPGSIGPLSVVTGAEVFSNQNIIGSGPIPLPQGMTITGGTTGSVPSVRVDESHTLTAQGCQYGSATYTITQLGNWVAGPTGMDEMPLGSGSGYYEATIPPYTFAQGAANQITIDINCSPDPPQQIVVDVYIDPSGFTRFLDGSPAVGATVTLLHSETPIGPFTVVPDGSNIMSPKNRTNPDTSDATGHFGWDVMPGWYMVRAEISGCVVESAVLTIPPAVTDLDLVFQCPCVAGPRPSCRTAQKGQLQITDDPNDDKDSFQWKWSGGQATSQADFGTPVTTTDYEVCVYAGSSVPLVALTVPSDMMNWSATGSDGTKGYKYGDSEGMNDGVTKVMLTASTDDRSRVLVKGKGLDLPDPTLGGLPVPITVQLQRTDSALCFGSTFDLNDVLDNSAGRLKTRVQ